MKVDFIDGLSEHVGAKGILFAPPLANAMLETQTIQRITEQLQPLMRNCMSIRDAYNRSVRFMKHPAVYEVRISRIVATQFNRWDALRDKVHEALATNTQKERFYAHKVTPTQIEEHVQKPFAALGAVLGQWLDGAEWKREADLVKPELPKGAHGRFTFEHELDKGIEALERELKLPKFTASLALPAGQAPTRGR